MLFSQLFAVFIMINIMIFQDNMIKNDKIAKIMASKINWIFSNSL